ncbi:hypothetical protein [Vibrio anguillarum]|uniref:hypothetical protein n=1 Tax=Vibrio anguillarum TaxID=55601 RepID=UPI0009807259|nr:hypothetical protein [Vibrio anguillarum]AQP38113.1 hypothetical protein AA909_17370 [Vibrio anguillarum]
MGFFDSLVSAGKAAVKAAGDTATKSTLEHWGKISNAPRDRVLDYYHQNNKQESQNSLKRALAIAALQDHSLFSQDVDAKRQLIRLREKVSLDDSSQARTLMRAIDNLQR